MIELEGITKRFGEVIALDRVSLKIDEARIFAVIGNSGAGKTTLLRIISLLERQDEGRYLYKGEDAWSKEEDLKRRITMVFQKPVMFNTTVYNNIAYGLKLRGYTREEIKTKVAEMLELVRLEGYEKKNAKRLSGGEQQRVAIARALITEPELLVLDEPTANLDAANASVVERCIKELVGDGTTVIMATHNLFQAKRLSDRVAYLFNGRLIEVGKTERVFEKPENELTEKFINGELYF
jgi:tungstate transport system ATP-binding protein